MTMQVGMVGTDGIVLASDTKHHQETTQGVRSTYDASKINISHERAIAVSRAKNMETASRVADCIIAGLSDADMSSPARKIEEIAQPVIDDAGLRNDVQCLIVLLRPRLQLIRLRTFPITGGGHIMTCDEEIVGKAYAGDLGNAAIFWGEVCYERRPIKQLARLAAQLVVMAGKINSGSVGGLEVVLCEATGFRRLSVDSNRALEAAVNELHDTTRISLANYPHEFTYAPNLVG